MTLGRSDLQREERGAMVKRVVYGLGGALAFALGVVLLIKVDGSFFAGFFLCFAGGAAAIGSLLKDKTKTSTLTHSRVVDAAVLVND